MSEWRLSTPVVFVIFNRPETTKIVFDAIRQARPSKLLVIADGPRQGVPTDFPKCEETRRIIDNVDWPCEVLKNYADENLGCRKRPISGYDWVFENVEEAIILEDDCVPHPSFFRFCEELLVKYRNDQRIGIISGNNFQFGKTRTQYSYYFSRFTHIWGWATWRRVWANYDANIKLWPEIRDSNWLYDIWGQKDHAKIWTLIFNQVYNLNIATCWDFQLTFACWINNFTSVIPNVNLVSNIGYGAGATHTKKVDRRSNMQVEAMPFPLSHPPYIINDLLADRYSIKTIYGKGKISDRIIGKIQRYIRGE